MATVEFGPISGEFSGAELGDARLEKRVLKIADTLAAMPDESFPTLTSNDSELEAFYRFFNNEKVEAELVLAPHFRETARRAALELEKSVVVIHDTTAFSFGGQTKRKGLGRLKTGSEHAVQGFYAHMALVSSIETGAPLGVLGVVPVVREGPPVPYPDFKPKRHGRVREFERWERLVDEACARLGEIRAIHVMDREADAFSVFHQLTEKEQDFVIRAKGERVLDVPRGDREEPRLLSHAIERGKYVMSREVQLSAKRSDRMARLRKIPQRMMRIATLDVSVTHVNVRHPTYVAGRSRHGSPLPRSVPVNVVHVREVDTPSEQTPVEWTLLTTLPIDTEEEVQFVIDCYRRRWLIEEYFKAIKTGCAFEKRQLESRHALMNALAVFVPIAWRLLLLRYLAREAPNRPATDVLSERQIKILSARKKVPLGNAPTVRQAMLAVAAEGGHIKNNGDPGWQVLGRGFEKLLDMELGYSIAENRRKI